MYAQSNKHSSNIEQQKMKSKGVPSLSLTYAYV